MRTCKACGESKPLEEFFRNRGSAGGRLPRCRVCVNTAAAELRLALNAARPVNECACGCGQPTQTAYVAGHACRKDPGVPEGALFDEQDRSLAEGAHWFNSMGYVVRDVTGEQGQSIRLHFHREVMNAPVGLVVDHINGNGLDNRRSNLRVVSHAVNGQNRTKLDSRNKTGFRGVVYRSDIGKYVAYGAIKRKYVHLGSFTSITDAARVARQFRLERYPGTIEDAIRSVPL
jgi:HNH endonuclease/AP2 domain